jgi:hypothetical protein
MNTSYERYVLRSAEFYLESYGAFHFDCNCCFLLRIHIPTLGTLIENPHHAVYMRLSVSFFARSKFPLADNAESNGKNLKIRSTVLLRNFIAAIQCCGSGSGIRIGSVFNRTIGSGSGSVI